MYISDVWSRLSLFQKSGVKQIMLNNVDIDNLLITIDEIAYVMGNLIDWCLTPTLVVGLGILTHMIPTYT
jgi:hypothetical protein